MPPAAFDLPFDRAAAAAVPHLDQYFGLWAMQEAPMLAMAERIRTLNLQLHLAGPEPEAARGRAAGRSEFEMVDGVALIYLEGSLMKHAGSFGGASTVQARRQVRAAAADPAVAAILLAIDSPGGTVAGTADLAADVAAAAAEKPCFTLFEDLGASAAYWIGSQARKVYAANATTLVGCIGTYGVVEDSSAQAAMVGVKVHVVRAGAMKGAGTPGTEITSEQLAEFQRVVDQQNEHFMAGVAAGRHMPMDRVRPMADGRVHVGQAAVQLGLIDGVKSFDQVFAELLEASRNSTPNPSRRSRAMSQETDPKADAPRAATFAELKAAFPKADAAFLVQQLENGATLDQARAAHVAALEARAEAAEKRASDLASRQERPGVEPLGAKTAPKKDEPDGDEPGNEDDPKARFDALVRQRVAAGATRTAAVVAVAQQHPELHRAFLIATNPKRYQRRLLGDKFDMASEA